MFVQYENVQKSRPLARVPLYQRSSALLVLERGLACPPTKRSSNAALPPPLPPIKLYSSARGRRGLGPSPRSHGRNARHPHRMPVRGDPPGARRGRAGAHHARHGGVLGEGSGDAPPGRGRVGGPPGVHGQPRSDGESSGVLCSTRVSGASVVGFTRLCVAVFYCGGGTVPPRGSACLALSLSLAPGNRRSV